MARKAEVQTTAQKEWAEINKFLDKQGELSFKPLGRTLKEYVEESIHSGWEGFSSHDVTGIRRMLVDLIIYHNNR